MASACLTSRGSGRKDAESIPKFCTVFHMRQCGQWDWQKSLRQLHLRPSRYMPHGEGGATELVEMCDRTLDKLTESDADSESHGAAPYPQKLFETV